MKPLVDKRGWYPVSEKRDWPEIDAEGQRQNGGAGSLGKFPGKSVVINCKWNPQEVGVVFFFSSVTFSCSSWDLEQQLCMQSRLYFWCLPHKNTYLKVRYYYCSHFSGQETDTEIWASNQIVNRWRVGVWAPGSNSGIFTISHYTILFCSLSSLPPSSKFQGISAMQFRWILSWINHLCFLACFHN
jgi:hypothetical protein